MKYSLSRIVTSLLIFSSLSLLSSCNDDDKHSKPKEEEINKDHTKVTVKKLNKNVAHAALLQSAQNILKRASYLEIDKDAFLAQEIKLPNTGSAKNIICHIPLRLRESLYRKEAAPEFLNKLRKAIDNSINEAKRPDADYLIRIGAPSDIITSEHRNPHALPDDVRILIEKMHRQCTDHVYILDRAKGSSIILDASISQITSKENQEAELVVQINEAKLEELIILSSQSQLGEQARIQSPEWLEHIKISIEDNCQIIQHAIAPYLFQREDDARSIMLKAMSLKNEKRHQKEEKEIAYKTNIIKAFADKIRYHGEWTRANKFGKMSLEITSSEILEQSMHFIGKLYDSDIPAAVLNISGRCELKFNKEFPEVTIRIYHGKYNPDKATAEAFDAKDAYMTLQLNPVTKQLTGSLSTETWKNKPGKAFNIQLSEEVKAPVTK